MYTRRDLGRIALASIPSIAAAKPDSKIGGVQIGAQSNSFSDRPLEEAIRTMAAIGISLCELWMGHVEPKPAGRGQAGLDLRQWRQETPPGYFNGIARQFRRAGIQLFAYDYSFRETFEDDEIDRGFQMARALGVKCITTASATVSLARRIAPYAEKYKLIVGVHGRTNVKDPNEFARPESYETAMSFSPYIGLCLDIGHFFAAGFDPVSFIEKHHARIVCIHLKDRKKDQGPSRPFGEGDTPVRECLQLLKRNRWKFPANIEYDHRAGDPAAGFKKAYEYCRAALA